MTRQRGGMTRQAGSMLAPRTRLAHRGRATEDEQMTVHYRPVEGGNMACGRDKRMRSSRAPWSVTCSKCERHADVKAFREAEAVKIAARDSWMGKFAAGDAVTSRYGDATVIRADHTGLTVQWAHDGSWCLVPPSQAGNWTVTDHKAQALAIAYDVQRKAGPRITRATSKHYVISPDLFKRRPP